MWDVNTCLAAARFVAELAHMADPLPVVSENEQTMVQGSNHAACFARLAHVLGSKLSCCIKLCKQQGHSRWLLTQACDH